MFEPSKLADLEKTKKDILNLKTTMAKQEWDLEEGKDST